MSQVKIEEKISQAVELHRHLLALGELPIPINWTSSQTPGLHACISTPRGVPSPRLIDQPFNQNNADLARHEQQRQQEQEQEHLVQQAMLISALNAALAASKMVLVTMEATGKP